jgi:hypothetical protein
VRSRVLIGAGAWLLGAVSATVGSLYAVDLLGQGLLEQHTQQVSVAMVNAELAQDNSAAPSRSPAPSQTSKSSPAASRPARHRPAATHPAVQPSTSSAGKILTTGGGNAAARCEQGGAYLLYWSPAQGFEVDDVSRGPAPATSVTFANSTDGFVLTVTCSSGVPVEHVKSWQWGGGTRHDEWRRPGGCQWRRFSTRSASVGQTAAAFLASPLRSSGTGSSGTIG